MLYHAYTQAVADGTATTVVRPSDWNSAHVHAMTISGNTAGQSTVSGTNIVFQGGNNVTLSANTAAGAATIVVSAPNQSAFVLSNSNNVSFGTNGSTVTASASFPAQTQFVLSNANGISFGTNGSTVTATYTVPSQTVQPVAYSAGNGSANFSTLKFADSQGVSFSTGTQGVYATVATNYAATNITTNNVATSQSSLFQHTSATSAITSNAFPTANSSNLVATSQSSLFQHTSATSAITSNAAHSTHSHNFATTTTNGSQIVVGTANSVGATIGVPAFLTTYTQPGVTVFSNSNNVSFGLNGSTVTATATFAQSNQTGNLYVGGNTTQLSSTAGIDHRSLSFAGAGIASVGVSGGSVLISVPAGGGGGDGYNIVQIGTTGTTGTAWSSLSGTVQINGSDGIYVSQNNSNQIVIGANPINMSLVGNTAGNNTVADGTNGTWYLSGGNNITLSGNGSTLAIHGAAGGGGGTLGFYEPNIPSGTSYSSFGQNSLYFLPIKPVENVSFTGFNMIGSLTNSSSTVSHAVSQTISYGLYSLGTGTQSTALYSIATSSMAITASATSSGNAGFTLAQGTNSTTISSTAHTGFTSYFTGQRILNMPFSSTLSVGGEYYFAIAQSTTGTNASSCFRLSHLVCNPLSNGSVGRFGPSSIGASNASIIPNFAGFQYTATSGAWPSSIALSQRSAMSNARIYLYLDA